MPWSTGNFTRTDGTRSGSKIWDKAKNAAIKILSADHDTHDQDLADGIDSCLNKDGSNAMTGNLNMGGHDVTNAGNISEASFVVTVEGATTPGTFSYTTRQGRYAEVGNLVFVSVLIKGSWTSDPVGQMRVSGLTQVCSFDSKLNVTHSNLSTDSDILCAIAAGNDYFTFSEYTTNGAASGIDYSDTVSATQTILISGGFIKQ